MLQNQFLFLCYYILIIIIIRFILFIYFPNACVAIYISYDQKGLPLAQLDEESHIQTG